MADIQILLGKYSLTEAEPVWFVQEWRRSDNRGKLLALAKLTRD